MKYIYFYIIRNIIQKNSVSEDVKNLEPLCTADMNVKSIAAVENSIAIP